MLVNFDTNQDVEIDANSTPAQYIQHIVYQAVTSFQQRYGGTRDQAISSALDNAVPDAGGKTGMRARIKAEANRRKNEGTFLPAGETKWLPAEARSFLAMARHLPNTEIAPMQIDAADGTRFNLSGAKVTAAIQAWAAKMIAIDTARDNALAAYQANPTTFNFDAIVWPAEYTPV